MSWRSPAIRFGALVVALAFLVRMHQMLLPMQDGSIGLYAHIAKAWFAGHAPYTTTWEYKPPGLFLIYAIALWLIPSPALAIQLLGVSSVAVTALALWKLGPLIDRDDGELTGRCAALFFVMLSIEDDGFVTDAEILIDPLIALAVWLALRRPAKLRAALGIGLLLGAALQCKLSALPLVAPALAIVAIVSRERIAALAGAFLGIVTPFALEFAGYAAIGQLPALLFANAGATAARVTGLRSGLLTQNIPIFVKHLRIYAPAIEFAILAFTQRFTPATFLATFGWLAAAIVSIVAIGEFYSRQFLLACPPIALLGGFGLRCFATWLAERSFNARAAVAVVLIVTFGMHGYYETLQAGRVALGRGVVAAWHVPDRFSAVLRELACVRDGRDSVYLVSLSPFVYDLAHVTSPTRFPFTDHLLDDRMGVMIGVDPLGELQRIFATRPHVIVADDDYRTNAQYDAGRVRFIDERLARDYVAVASFPHTTFYVRRDAPDAAAIARRCADTAKAL